MTQRCMGGWCRKRDVCAAYTPGDSVSQPSERLCAKGIDTPRKTTVMSINKRIAHHTALAEAHMVIVQKLKYPGTVSASAVKEAEKRINREVEHE